MNDLVKLVTDNDSVSMSRSMIHYDLSINDYDYEYDYQSMNHHVMSMTEYDLFKLLTTTTGMTVAIVYIPVG